MLVHESSVSYHEHPIKNEKVDDNAINDKKNLFETMYKICLVCFVEAVKIIGHKLQEHLVQVSKSSISQKKGGKSSWPHPVPSRTHSRVIKISSKRWIKKQRSKNTSESSTVSSSCSSSYFLFLPSIFLFHPLPPPYEIINITIASIFNIFDKKKCTR